MINKEIIFVLYSGIYNVITIRLYSSFHIL
jgi:hypothetical protein